MNTNKQYKTITLIHTGTSSSSVWWKDCVVYDLPFPADKNDLSLFSQSSHDLVQLGINAVLVRPSNIDFTADEDFISDFIKVFHRVGLKVIFQLSGPVSNETDGKFTSPFIGFEKDSSDLIKRATIAVNNGVDGIDLGFIIEADMDSELAVNPKHFDDMTHALKDLANSVDREIIVTASCSEYYNDRFTKHFENDTIQHMRTDSLVNAPFEAKVFFDKIRDSYNISKSDNYRCAWQHHVNNSLHNNYPMVSSWSKTTEKVEYRISALQLLFLGLPGSVYINYYDELGLPLVEKNNNFSEVFSHANNVFEQQRKADFSTWKSYKNALTTRAQHNMGSGTIAKVSGFDWSNENTLVLVCEQIYIVVNMSDKSITIPKNFDLLVASRTDVESEFKDQTSVDDFSGTVLPPETTGWFRSNDSSII